MLAEIITIGDEILIGQVVDTNSAWIAQELNLIGFKVKQITSVSDERQHILTALKEAESRANLVLITGGLGPTKDDITKDALCEYFNSKLVFHQEAYENLERLFKRRNNKIMEVNRKQADLPHNCQPLKNIEGTAYGMWFEKETKVFVSMPGVPYEMKTIMAHEVLPRIKKHFKTPSIIHRTVLTQGVGESVLAEIISVWEDALPSYIRLAYLPSPGIVRLRLSAIGENYQELSKEIDIKIKELQQLIPEYIFGYDLEKLEEIIGKLLIARKATLSTAESCTGGYIAHLITSVPGSSEYFIGSIVPYANQIKEEELGVNKEDLIGYGAVSQQVVEKMALDIKNKYKTNYAIATSGIAGPTGGTPEKPVGTVWIAIASPQRIVSRKLLLGQNRERNILITALSALNLLRKEINDETRSKNSK